MGIDIREIGPDDFEAVLKLWGETKIERFVFNEADTLQEFLRRQRGLSIRIVDDGKLMGVVLCDRHGSRERLHQVAISPSPDSDRLARQIVGKALMKLLAAGHHLCQIELSPNIDTQRFWDSVRWTTPTDETSGATVAEPVLEPVRTE